MKVTVNPNAVTAALLSHSLPKLNYLTHHELFKKHSIAKLINYQKINENVFGVTRPAAPEKVAAQGVVLAAVVAIASAVRRKAS